MAAFGAASARPDDELAPAMAASDGNSPRGSDTAEEPAHGGDRRRPGAAKEKFAHKYEISDRGKQM